MHCRDGYAISEIVGFVLMFAFVASIISMTLVWALPFMNDQKADVRVDSALNQFEILDITLHDMIGQGVNSSRVLNFVTDAGYVYVSKTSGTRFVIYYSLDSDFDFNVSGFDMEAVGYNEKECLAEVERCLRCDIRDETEEDEKGGDI